MKWNLMFSNVNYNNLHKKKKNYYQYQNHLNKLASKNNNRKINSSLHLDRHLKEHQELQKWKIKK